MMRQSLQTTTDHRTIRHWVEQRGGKPAVLEPSRVPVEENGVLRINFPEEQPDGVEFVPWERFFERFDQARLAFVYQDRTPEGSLSHFFKFVSRNGE